MSEEELKGFVEESRKTGRLLTLSIVINIASLGLLVFAFICK
jgi:hypothetical protein